MNLVRFCIFLVTSLLLLGCATPSSSGRALLENKTPMQIYNNLNLRERSASNLCSAKHRIIKLLLDERMKKGAPTGGMRAREEAAGVNTVLAIDFALLTKNQNPKDCS